MSKKNVLDYYGIQYVLSPVDRDNRLIVTPEEGNEYDVFMGTKEFESAIFIGFRNTGYRVIVESDQVIVWTDRTDMPYGLALELALMSVPEGTNIQFKDNRLGYAKTADATQNYSDMVPIEYYFSILPTTEEV